MFEFLRPDYAATQQASKQKPIAQVLAEDNQAREAAQERKEQTTIADGIGAAAVQGSIGTIDRFLTELGYEPDAGWEIPADREKRWKELGIPNEQWQLFGRAVSEDHLGYLETLAIQNTMAQQDMAQFSLVGQIGLGMTDPGMFAVDAASGGISRLARAGRLANAALAGTVAAGTNTAMTAASSHYDPSVTLRDMAITAGTSFALAGALGARNGHLREESVTPSRVKALVNDESLSAAKVAGLPEDETPGVTPLRNETPKEQSWLDKAYANAHLRPAFAQIRRDLSARMGKSEHAVVREAGRALFQDGVGYVDMNQTGKAAQHSAGRMTAVKEATTGFSKRHLATLETEMRAGTNAVWHAHRKANGVHWWDFPARARFNEEVGRAVRGASDVSPEAKAAAQSVANVTARALKLAQEVGLEGFDNLTANPNYLPRYFSANGFRRLFVDHGLDENDVVEQVIKPAMRKRWEELLPERGESKVREIETDYEGTSTAAREASTMADEYQTQFGEFQQRLQEAEDTLAALGDNASAKRIRAAERKVAQLTDKLQRAEARFEKARARLADAIKKEDDSRFALDQARKVADMDTIDEDLLDAVSRAYLKRAQANFEGDGDALLVRPMGTEDVDQIEELLRDAGVDKERMASILGRLKRNTEEAGKMDRAKHRIDLDETFETTMTNASGEEIVVRMSDLFENNIDEVLPRYLREVVGWSALKAKLGIENRSQLNAWRNQVEKAALGSGGQDHLSEVKRMLDIGINATLGKSTEVDPGGKMSRYGRFFRQYNFARLMNQVGFSLFAELGPTIAYSGLKNFVESTMHVKDFIRRGADGKLLARDAQVVEELFAPGTDWMRNPPFMRMEDDAFVPPTFGNNGFGRGADNVMMASNHVTSIMSGMAPINLMLQRIAGRGTLLRLLDMANAKKLSNAEVARLRNWGLDEADQAKLFAVLKGKRKIAGLDPSQLDFATRERMAAFLSRVTRHQVVDADPSDSLVLMHDPVGKLVMQFRTFMVNSYTRHFLNSARHLDDWRTYAMMTLSTAAAGMGWTARTYLNTIGDEEARKERLTVGNFYRNAVAQSSYSSIGPMLTDLVWADVLRNDPVFRYNRSTGLENGIMGIPTLDLVNKVYSSAGILGTALQDDQHVTEGQMRDFWKTLIFQNMTGARHIAREAMEPMPDRQKRRERDDEPGTPLFPQ